MALPAPRQQQLLLDNKPYNLLLPDRNRWQQGQQNQQSNQNRQQFQPYPQQPRSATAYNVDSGDTAASAETQDSSAEPTEYVNGFYQGIQYAQDQSTEDFNNYKDDFVTNNNSTYSYPMAFANSTIPDNKNSTNPAYSCHFCHSSFPSNNKLHNHVCSYTNASSAIPIDESTTNNTVDIPIIESKTISNTPLG
jgi:hypothetical protein